MAAPATAPNGSRTQLAAAGSAARACPGANGSPKVHGLPNGVTGFCFYARKRFSKVAGITKHRPLSSVQAAPARKPGRRPVSGCAMNPSAWAPGSASRLRRSGRSFSECLTATRVSWISRQFYQKLGGHRPLPELEDLDIAKRIGRSRIVFLRAAAVTSGQPESDSVVSRFRQALARFVSGPCVSRQASAVRLL